MWSKTEEICYSKIRKNVGMTAFFEKSYKNTRTREEWSEPVLGERRVRIISVLGLEKAAEALMVENGDQIPISRKTSAIWEIPEKSKER